MAMPVVTMAQNQPTFNEWHDMQVNDINRFTPHTWFFAYENEQVAGWDDKTKSDNYLSLEGKWKFHWVKTPNSLSNTWCEKDYNDASWTDIDVPSSWQVWGLNHGKAWD